jgi:SAM-dependent methyltransferase
VNRSKFALVPLRAADNLLLVDADPVEMVRSGYNAISGAYRSDDDIQIERARRLVPGAVFLCADAAETDFPPGSFDAVVCLYALIHMPLDRQPLLLRDIVRWLRPGGWLLAVTGQDAWTGTEDNWLGGTAPMWWSHADAATYRTWLTQAGMEVTSQQFVPEGDGGHALFWARLKPAGSPQAGTADGSSALASGAQANPQSTSAACRSQEPR